MLHNLRREVVIPIESDTKELLNRAGWLCMPWYLLTYYSYDEKGSPEIEQENGGIKHGQSNRSSAHNNSDEKEKHNVVVSDSDMRQEERELSTVCGGSIRVEYKYKYV